MCMRNVLMLTAMLLMSAVAVLSQEKVKKYGDMIITPEMEEKAKRQYEKLKNPDFLKVEIARANPDLGDASERLAKTYKVGRKIVIYIALTNTQAEPLDVLWTDQYSQYRPELLKDGRPVPYRERVAKLVKAKDSPMNHIRMRQMRLESQKPGVVQTIDLNDWYEPLEPGSYQLTIRYRAVLDGNWITSPPVTFEVTA